MENIDKQNNIKKIRPIIYLSGQTKQNLYDTLTQKQKNNYYIRSSEHVAKTTHFCDYCCRYINPGEIYKKDIRIINNKVVEFKQHTNPGCDFRDDRNLENLETDNILESIEREAA